MIRTSKKSIAERQFVIDAPQKRVWDLLARAVYQSLPLEKIDIVNERTFFAELRWNLAFVGLRFHLKGEFVDISPPSFLGCMISVKKGIIQLDLRITFALRAVNRHKTEVVCIVAEDGKLKMLSRWVMRIPQRSFAGNVFNSIKARLERIC